MLESQVASPLLLSLLTAIPKPGRDTATATNLRPISVSSVFYRLLMKIFVNRLTPFVPMLFSDD